MNRFKLPYKKNGYTLIEILIVIGIIGVIIPTLFTIIYIILQQQARIYRLVETKRQGDYMLNFIKEKVTREAGSIKDTDISDLPENDQCNTTGDLHSSNSIGGDFVFMSKTDPTQYFRFTTADNILSYSENTTFTTSMHNSNVKVLKINFSCTKRSAFSPPFISVNFTVTFNDPSPTDTEGTVSLPYQSKFILR